MNEKFYRMRVLSIIGWTFYTIFTKAILPAAILLVGSIIFIVGSLDQILHVNNLTALIVYLLLVSIYILYNVIQQVISLSFDTSKIAIRNFYKRYEFNWREIKSINEISKKPRFIGVSSYAGDICTPMVRKVLVIETDFRKFNVELTQNSFGMHTIQLPLDLKKYKEGKIDVDVQPVVSTEKLSFHSESDAFDFFIEKIKKESEITGLSLSDLDLKMLRFSVENENADSDLAERFEEACKQKIENCKDLSEFEEKIVYLLKSHYDKEISASPDKMVKEAVKNNYQEAYNILKKKDNYINVIIDQALGRDLAKGLGRFFK